MERAVTSFAGAREDRRLAVETKTPRDLAECLGGGVVMHAGTPGEASAWAGMGAGRTFAVNGSGCAACASTPRESFLRSRASLPKTSPRAWQPYRSITSPMRG
jgi:hypothetical protein